MNSLPIVLLMALMAVSALAGGSGRIHTPDNVDEVRAILLMYDKDGDNKVSKEEAITGMLSHDPNLTKENAVADADKLLKQYDTNKDGLIALAELEKLFGL